MTTERMQVIVATSRADAWLKAVKALVKDRDWEAFHMVVEIENATNSGQQDKDVEDAIDNFLVNHGAQPLQTVAETIFPASEYRRYGTSGVYRHYPDKVFPNIKDGTWGTYAQRLLRRTDHKGNTFNPLMDCVKKIKRQLNCQRRFRGIFDIDIVDSGFDLHTYDARLDRKRLRGGPCLSHLSFKLSNQDQLFVAVTYRYHYYMERFLGNMLGLGQLQYFVCEQTGLVPGPLLCVSSLAKLETGPNWGKRDIRDLIRHVKKLRISER